MNNNHHDHDVDVMRYTVALYRAKMYFLAQQYPEESYDNLHWNVLEEIRYVCYVIKRKWIPRPFQNKYK